MSRAGSGGKEVPVYGFPSFSILPLSSIPLSSLPFVSFSSPRIPSNMSSLIRSRWSPTDKQFLMHGLSLCDLCLCYSILGSQFSNKYLLTNAQRVENHASRNSTFTCIVTHVGHKSLPFFIQIPYRLFESYVHHVAVDKLVDIPTKMAAGSVKWC